MPTVTVLCTLNFACTNVLAEPFYVHKNQCMQILNLSSPETLPFSIERRNSPILSLPNIINLFNISFLAKTIFLYHEIHNNVFENSK